MRHYWITITKTMTWKIQSVVVADVQGRRLCVVRRVLFADAFHIAARVDPSLYQRLGCWDFFHFSLAIYLTFCHSRMLHSHSLQLLDLCRYTTHTIVCVQHTVIHILIT